jgi:hypothetical protein
VAADMGYTGEDNHQAIAKVGAVPHIAFKANATVRQDVPLLKLPPRGFSGPLP